MDEEAEVNLFKEFVRIPTVHPNPDLTPAVTWLKKQAETLHLNFQLLDFSEAKNKPIVILSLPGLNPNLPSLGLNCHMDVVPVEAELWSALPSGETPFSAWEDVETGRIYGRGTQDMKCCGVQYLCALRRLMAKKGAFQNAKQTPIFTSQHQKREKKVATKDSPDQNKTEKNSFNFLSSTPPLFLRTIHLVWVPDEEIGGVEGMKKFVLSAEFRALNFGLFLDEGLADESDKMIVYVGERTPLWVRLSAQGLAGHGLSLLPNTAVDRLTRAMTRCTANRDVSIQRLAENEKETRDQLSIEFQKKKTLGDVTSWNVTALQAGVTKDGGRSFAPNVVPTRASCLVDIRVCPSEFESVFAEVKSIAEEFNLSLEFVGNVFDPAEGPSPFSCEVDGSPTLNSQSTAGSFWFARLMTVLTKQKFEVDARVFPGATDSRYVRRAGIPAFGFSPMPQTPSLLHDHNEFLERRIFLQGVRIYEEVIEALASAPESVGANL